MLDSIPEKVVVAALSCPTVKSGVPDELVTVPDPAKDPIVSD